MEVYEANIGLEVIVIGILLLLFFGGKKIGEVGKGLGEGIRNFKKELHADDEPKKPPENPS